MRASEERKKAREIHINEAKKWEKKLLKALREVPKHHGVNRVEFFFLSFSFMIDHLLQHLQMSIHAQGISCIKK